MNARQQLVVAAAVAATLAVVLTGPRAWAQARPRAFDPELLRSGDLIRYRDLRRADFLADQPPEEAVGVHQLGAATCVYLTTDPRTAVRTTSQGDDERNGLVSAQVENLGFVALMDRECSWWNPGPLSLPAEYILQHEQIHFALFEIAARRLNSRVEEMSRRMQTVAATQQGAFDVLSRQIDREMQRAMDELLARSNEFDRDTSRTYRQDRQNWWWNTVRGELRRLAAADRAP